MTTSENDTQRHKPLRAVAVLPSLVTLLNAVCGFTAIHFAARGMNDPHALWFHKPPLTFFAAAGYMIFFAMIADALDGFLARKSGSASDFGEQLDSLADIISFGIAPAFLMIRVVESSLQDVVESGGPAFTDTPGKLLWLVAVAYLCCAALRLARFNVETAPEESAHKSFSGLPTPAAAGVIASLVLLTADLLPELQEDIPRTWVVAATKVIVYALPVVTLGLSLLMVSRVPYRHVVNHYIRGRKPLEHVVRVLLLLFVLILNPQLTMAIAFVSFASWGAIAWLWRKRAGSSSLGREDQPIARAAPCQDSGPADA